MAQTVPQLISYFLIAGGVSELVTAQWGGVGQNLGRLIRYGRLSDLLIKPVSIIPTLFFSDLGSDLPEKILAVLYIIVGLGINPPHNVLAFILFALFFVSSAIISLCYMLLLACMYFYVPEASGIRSSIQHMARIFSGAAIPLTFFPPTLYNIVRFLPFQTMIYAPTKALSTNAFSSDVWVQLITSAGWMVVFIFVARFVWLKSIKNYEASGI